MGKIEPLRRTPYLDDCMRVLVDQRESDLDLLLVANVRCHLAMDQATLCLSRQAQGSEASGILASFVRALEAQLEEIRTSLPTELPQNSKHKRHGKSLGENKR